MGLAAWFNKTFRPDEHDLAFKAARENPTTDHELLCLFESGDFKYEMYRKPKTPEDYEAENWDEGREPR